MSEIHVALEQIQIYVYISLFDYFWFEPDSLCVPFDLSEENSLIILSGNCALSQVVATATPY